MNAEEWKCFHAKSHGKLHHLMSALFFFFFYKPLGNISNDPNFNRTHVFGFGYFILLQQVCPLITTSYNKLLKEIYVSEIITTEDFWKTLFFFFQNLTVMYPYKFFLLSILIKFGFLKYYLGQKLYISVEID